MEAKLAEVRGLKLEKLLLFARWLTLVVKSFPSEKKIQMVERVHCFFLNPLSLLLVGMKMVDMK